MTYTDLTPTQLTPEDIRPWLVRRVAYYVQQPASQIDPDVSVAEYGLDSVYAFTLCGEIEDELGLSVEPTVIWDFDTLNALTTHLIEFAAETSAESATTRPNCRQVERMGCARKWSRLPVSSGS